jgi:hypothetical protein
MGVALQLLQEAGPASRPSRTELENAGETRGLEST